MRLRRRSRMLYSSSALTLRLWTDLLTSSSAERSRVLLVAMNRSQFFLLMIAAFFSPSRKVIRARIGVGKSFKKLSVVV